MPFDLEMQAAAGALWQEQLAHPFVTAIGDGSLPRERFQHYVAQDYLFLIDYGRLLALGTARAPDLPTMRRFADLTQSILVTEMDLHRSLAAGWGIAEVELAATEPTPATSGYVDFLVRTAALGDFSELVAALLPCMWSYAEIGALLAGRRAAGAVDPGPYGAWVDTYSDPEFVALADWCRALAAELGAGVSPAVRERMVAAFRGAVAHEVRFWDSAWLAA